MTECSICLDDIKELKVIHGCKQSELHTFHLECIQSLVKNNFKNCPMCKSELKNEYLNVNEDEEKAINRLQNHPQKHSFWRSFLYSYDEEATVYYELCENIFTTYDALIKKVPRSEFSLVEHHRCSIFKKLLIMKTKESLERLKALASNLAYYPHDLDIVLSTRKGYPDLAISLINNRRYNPLYSNHTMMVLELEEDADVYYTYMKKHRDCSTYYH